MTVDDYDRAHAEALDQVRAEDAAQDRHPAAIRALIAAERRKVAAQEAALLLSAPNMTPARVRELMLERTPPPLTDEDGNCDGLVDPELIEMIYHAKARQIVGPRPPRP